MQLRVMIYTESDKSAVFTLIICPYTQNLDKLQQPDLTGIFGTNNIILYSFATQPWVVTPDQINVLVVGFPDPNYPESEF